MELHQLSYFVTVAEELHFGRAAQRLHIVQSAVSQQVRRLERELGIELFQRTSRSVTLTAAGARFLPAAREVLAAAARARASVADLLPATTLRLGTCGGLGDHLDRILEQLPQQFTVDLVAVPARERIEQVRSGQLDAAFVRNMTDHPELQRIPLWDEPLVVALSAKHPLAARDAIPLAELAAHPLRLVDRRENPALVDLVLNACQAAGFEPVPGRSAGALPETLALIGTDTSWTVAYAAHAVRLAVGRIVFRPIAGAALTLPTSLVVRRGRPAAGLPALLAAIDHDS
ncbi:LysR family transcriptional regulator [Nocardia stercoris]|uniref:LysR family transcriptional regulator n=2 Tax=Nocardia stercoris TaxID=2483361 RepID=A0A3M2LD89_9NOCA|nr:LysR family transcriptional regulator [Nocardia stercoris]